MFRTVLIKKASKLQAVQGYLVIYDGDSERKIFLKDISLLLIESMQTLITVPLMVQLVKNNTTVIFCDEKHNPSASLLGFNNNYNNSGNIFLQLKWDKDIKKNLWIKIVKQKILVQHDVLNILEKQNGDILKQYIEEVVENDRTNREGLAAKVYFFTLFGHDFNRKEQNVINGLLDYGYAIILSCFNREIIMSGYLTQLGIFHIGKTNPFNLSSDFMEPFRPIVDVIAYMNFNKEDPIKEMRKILTKKIIINNEKRFIDDAIGVYVNSLIRILNGENLKFPSIQIKNKEHYYND